MKKVLSTLLAATLLLTTVTGLKTLSVSAEGASETANTTVVFEDDFESYEPGLNTGTVWEDKLHIQRVTETDGTVNRTFRFQTAAARKVTLLPNTEYTLSFKVRGVDGTESMKEFGVIISNDARVGGKFTWNGFTAAAASSTMVAKVLEWTDQDATAWKEYSTTFTTPADLGESNERYLTAMTSWRALAMDELKLTRKYNDGTELISNGNFESAGNIIFQDDFSNVSTSRATWGNNGKNTAETKNLTENGVTNTTLRIQTPASAKISVVPGNPYTVSGKILMEPKSDGSAGVGGPFVIFVSTKAVFASAKTAGEGWTAQSNAASTKLGKTYSGNAASGFDTWKDFTFDFTVPADADYNEVYLCATTNWSGVLLDDIVVSDTSNAVKGKDIIVDPDNAENHCVQLATRYNDQLVVNKLAVKSNTFYKFSYKYKKVANHEYVPNAAQQLYCKIQQVNDTTKTLDVYNSVGTAISDNAISTWSGNLASAGDWKEYYTVFKTGTVDSTVTYRFWMQLPNTNPMYVDDINITELVSEKEVTDDFGFIGTAIRATDAETNNQQLRFKAEVNKEALAAKHYDGFTVTEYGFLAFRKDYLKDQNGELTLNVVDKDGNKKTALQKPAYVADTNGTVATDIVFSESNTAKQFYARITGFKPNKNYDKTYLVRTYAKLKNADGVELTVYVSDTTGLGVYELANVAYNQKVTEEYPATASSYTDANGTQWYESYETRQTLYNLLKNSSYTNEAPVEPQA